MIKKIITLFVLILLMSNLNAQFKVLLNFNDTNGSYPYCRLEVFGDVMYGTCHTGGKNGIGLIYSIDTNGLGYRDLYDFTVAGGAGSYCSLTVIGNKFYGTASSGGANYRGTVFSVDTNGNNYKDLHDFDITHGSTPWSSLTLVGGTLFGMTQLGGALDSGCIFSIDTNGSNFRKLLDFNGTNGSYPQSDIIALGRTLYGVSFQGGAHHCGCIFSIDTSGAGYRDLFDFSGLNGKNPNCKLTLLGNKFYGVTLSGGADSLGCVFSIDTNGNNYKDLLDFNGFGNGRYPYDNLIIIGGTIYGTASEDGYNAGGVIFKIDTNGTGFVDLYNFSTYTTGDEPEAPLVFYNNKFYGTTRVGGPNSYGNIFSFRDTSIITSQNVLIANLDEVKVYPNPSNGVFTFQASSQWLMANSRIEVYNVLGKEMMNETLRQAQGDNTIDLSDQPSGIYFYRIVSEKGDAIGSGKLIKQ